ncbi:DUF3934 domain-containing protein [Planococcus sp. YIM B11945]|uniref:DUF3934 domain-containing protein n=1 Tax=Planococcus sp. YIM B11945 TaxID=3435410 RepID=UPI003D7E28ED
MAKKVKSGIGQGTGKKGWNRWKVGANKAKSAKPYISKGAKRAAEHKADGKTITEPTEWIDG